LVWPWLEGSTNLSPFGESCFGLVFTESNVEYYVYTTIRVIQWQFPFCFFLGFLLFFSAGKLSRILAFFYLFGAGIGVLALLVVASLSLRRLIHHRAAEYTVVLGGLALCSYLMTWMILNFNFMTFQYKDYVAIAGYFIAAAPIGFATFYFYGPPEELEHQNRFKWTIQLIAACLLYWSTQAREVSCIVIIIVCILYWKRYLFGRFLGFEMN
jgi:hypothetical protein